MKRIALFFMLLIPLLAIDEFGLKIINFDTTYNAWTRQYFGCPAEGEITADTCKQFRAKMNFDSYKKCRKLAMDLFDLIEKEKACDK